MAMKSTMSEEDHMDSLYGEKGDMHKEGMHETMDQEEQEHAYDEFMVPTKALQGKSKEPLKAGEEVVVKVVKVYGDDTAVRYSETPPSEIGGEKEMSADEEIDKMDNPGKSMY